MESNQLATFVLGGMAFEYDEEKNRKNIRKHGISFKTAARVFFDYDRIEYYDEEHSEQEDRYDTIGDISAGNIGEVKETAPRFGSMIIGNVEPFTGNINDILYVVYTERICLDKNGLKTDVTRLISARLATNFERGLYYGKFG